MDFRIVSILLGQVLCLVFSIISMLVFFAGLSGVLIDISKHQHPDTVHPCLAVIAVMCYIASMKMVLVLERMLP